MAVYTRAHYPPTLKLPRCYKTDCVRLKWASGKESRTGYEECSLNSHYSCCLELPSLQLLSAKTLKKRKKKIIIVFVIFDHLLALGSSNESSGDV